MLPAAVMALLALTCRISAQETHLPDDKDKKDRDATATIERKEPSFWFWNRPTRDTAAAQMEFANQCRKEGRTGTAKSEYDTLVRQWPNSPEAAAAQLAYAELLEADKDNESAFEEYQYLVENYMGHFQFDDVMEHQFQLAHAVRFDRHMAFLSFVGLPGFVRETDALPLYETLARNAPNWKRAPEVLFLVGQLNEDNGDLDAAERAYDRIRLRHSRNALAPEAAFRRACCLQEIAADNPRDETRCRTALSAFSSFVRDYPNHPRLDDAQDRMTAMKTVLTDMYYERASFYDRVARRPASALIAYTDFVTRFPKSPQAAEANQRIREIKASNMAQEKHADD